ncbi:MAG UNVERIFIED_CONTAM: toll/interleukin-1 receptor domain-containing protein [Planctomycetaceae bacterium]
MRDSLSRYGQMDAWYDANELAIGDSWRGRILNAASKDTAAMIAIVTDSYSSRPWCRMEVETARTPQPVDSGTWKIWKLQPAVAVHLPGNRWSRTMQALAGLPRLGWNWEQPEVSIAEVVDRLMLETLLSYAHRNVARELKAIRKSTGILGKPDAICVTWTPCPYTLATLREKLASENSPVNPAKIMRIVYPGYDLRAAEAEELNTVLKSFNEQTKLVSFEEAFLSAGHERRKLPLPTESRSHRTKVAVSGIGDDSELQPHGIGCEHLDELLSRLTIALLTQNCQLILGGTIAKLDRAATARLLDIAQTWLPQKTLGSISLGTPRTWPFQNFLQWPDCEKLTPEHHASLAGVCHLRAVIPPGLPTAPMIDYLDGPTKRRYAADSSRMLRKSTTELANLRIIFGDC